MINKVLNKFGLKLTRTVAKTKEDPFEPGDEVWYMHNNVPQKFRVFSVIEYEKFMPCCYTPTEIRKTAYEIYINNAAYKTERIRVSKVFRTKEELIGSL